MHFLSRLLDSNTKMRLVITLLSRCDIENLVLRMNLVLNHFHNLSNKTLFSFHLELCRGSGLCISSSSSLRTITSHQHVGVGFYFCTFLTCSNSHNQNRKIYTDTKHRINFKMCYMW